MNAHWPPALARTRSSLKTIGRRLDEIPSSWLLAAGVLLGLGIGAAALLGVGGWIGQGLSLLALALAVAVGWNVRPVLVGGAPLPPAAAKQRVAPPSIEAEPVPSPEIVE